MLKSPAVETRRVRTLYACVGEHDTELSFEPNQIITSSKFGVFVWFKSSKFSQFLFGLKAVSFKSF